MSNPLEQLFHTYLLKEAEGDSVYRDRDFPEAQGSEFESGLDTGTDPTEYDTDDLGFDATEVAVDTFSEVYSKVSKIEDMMRDLVDPKVGKNLTQQLADVERKDSIGNGLLQKLEKPILKAVDALGSIKNQLDQIASMEPALKRRIEALESK